MLLWKLLGIIAVEARNIKNMYVCLISILLLCIYLKLQMCFYPVAVCHNETQHTNNTHHTNDAPHSTKHSTQNYTNNKGHTTHNEYNANILTATTNTITTTIKKTPWPLVPKQTIPTERPKLVGEVSANFLRIEGVAWSAQRIPTAVNIGFHDRSHYFFFQVAPQFSSRGWVDPVPDPLLLRKYGS
jgi:hypothetical protein